MARRRSGRAPPRRQAHHPAIVLFEIQGIPLVDDPGQLLAKIVLAANGRGRVLLERATEHPIDELLADLRHFKLEQGHEEFLDGPAGEQLRAAQLGLDLVHESPQAVAGTHRLARDHVALRDERFRVAAEIEVDIAPLDAFHDAVDQLAGTITSYRDKVDRLDDRLGTIVRHLRSGFRLREDE